MQHCLALLAPILACLELCEEIRGLCWPGSGGQEQQAEGFGDKRWQEGGGSRGHLHNRTSSSWRGVREHGMDLLISAELEY